MLEAPLPLDESSRLAVLLNLNILDTAPEHRFDRITRVASRLFQVPIAMVTLIDGERQWFKSRVGIDLTESPRRSSFCAHTILQDGVMVVEDASFDARFADNPLVTDGPKVRFYAGFPVAAPDGSKIGTLCLIDQAPRHFSADEQALLRDLAGMVAHEVAADQLQHALREQREADIWLRGLLDNAPDGVMLVGEDGTIVSINPAAEELFRCTSAALKGRVARTLMVETADNISAALEGGRSVTAEGTGRRPDGTTFPLEFSVRAMRLDGKRCYAAIVRDVARRREAELALRDRDARRSKYLATATHEMRTPMASVLGFSELLMKREFDQKAGQELVNIIHAQAGVLITVTNQLLDLARIEAGGKGALKIGIVSIAEVVQHTMLALEAQGRNARIRMTVDDTVAPVAADPTRLQQALVILLGNALNYSAADTQVAISVAPAPWRGMAGVAITVADHGIGMSEEQQARLYEAFYRARTKPEVAGSGMGMAIFREIADLHNAEVTVDSASGRGTTITMVLPAAHEMRNEMRNEMRHE
jgi:PAS domain S-box-containing protein